MSVKIYNGLISVENDPFVAAQKIREVLEPLFLSKFKEIYLKYKELPEGSQWDYYKEYFFNDTDKIEGLFLDSTLYKKMAELDKSAQLSLSDADIFYNVTLIPNGVKNGNPLILVFGNEADEYVNALLKAEVVLEFGYWDNVDPDESVTASEWEAREKSWSYLIEGAGAAPSQVGLQFTNPSEYDVAYSLII